MNDVTRILSAIDQGDLQAAEQLLPLVYDELRRLAGTPGDRQRDRKGAVAIATHLFLKIAAQTV
jgi:hypothetical protein